MWKASAAVALVSVLGWVLFGPNDDIKAYGSFAPGGPERVEGAVATGDGWTRRDVFFPAGGARGGRLHGWFYRPAAAFKLERLPVVVLASGLGAQVK